MNASRLVRTLAASSIAAISISVAAPAQPQSPPSILPPWIEQISPTDEAASLAQIRVRFANPLIPLEALESPDVNKKLSYFHIDPSLDGSFRFVTPRMVVFEERHALPDATRVTVTMKAGLSDLNGHSLAHDVAWTFSTTPLTLSLPYEGETWELNEAPLLVANTAIDLSSLRAKAHLVDAASGKTVPTTIEPHPDQNWLNDEPQTKFDPSIQSYSYIMRPRGMLAKDHSYKIHIDAGLVPRFGNMPSPGEYERTYSTYAPLRFIGLVRDGEQMLGERASMRFAGGTAELVFNNPLAVGTAAKNIRVESKDGELSGNEWHADGDGRGLTLDPWKLKPDTRYVVKVGQGVIDRWGQQLGHAETMTFDTDDIAADFGVETGLYTYPATLGLKLLARAISLPNDRYQAAFVSMTPAMLANSDEGPADFILEPWRWSTTGGDVPYPLPPVSQWRDFIAPATRNTMTSVDLGLAKQLGAPYGVLEYGMSAKIPGTLENPPNSLVVRFGRVSVTNLGLFAQVMHGEAIALVHHLSDGSPVAGGRIDFYLSGQSSGTQGPPVPCASGTTDRNGMLVLAGKSIRECGSWNLNSASPWGSQPEVVVVAASGSDWTYARMPSTEPIYLGWNDDELQERGTMFSDRGLYQPGEKASFEAYSFYLQGDAVQRDEHRRYSLTLRYPDDTTKSLGSRTTNGFGSFSYDMQLPKGLSLGAYDLEATAGNGLQLDCYFTVAEFKAPNFAVNIALDKRLVIAGDSVLATGTSEYLFGRPVDRGSTHVDVERFQTSYTPSGWSSFQFGREYWPRPVPTPSTIVLQADEATGVDGVVHRVVPVERVLPFAMGYRVEMTTKDASNLAVASSANFVALPSPELVGVRGPEVAAAGKQMNFDVIVVKPSGSPLSGEPIHAVLTRWDWDSKSAAYHETDLSAADVASGMNPATVHFTAKTPGWYRVRAMLPGSPADECDQDVWVYGPGVVDWGPNSDSSSVALQLDKKEYEPGDTATLLVKSPYAQADLYVAVVRRRTFFRSMRHVTGAAPTVSFTITPDMVPNASVEAVLVRRGSPISSGSQIAGLARFGSIAIPIQLDRRHLKVSVIARRSQERPGDTQTLDLRVADFAGDPVRGQFTVMVADEAILQLNRYRLPDMVSTIYSGWPVSASSADNRIFASLLQPTPAPTGAPEFAQRLFSAADTYTVGSKVIGHVTARAVNAGARVNFQQLAYFNGELQTGDDGTATVSFKAPDNLTTWRVMVVAEAAGGDPEPGDPPDYRFGGGDTTFITTLPLTANPLLPQFARPGDVFDGGVATDNNVNASGVLSLDGILGGSLAFLDGGRETATTSTIATASAGSQAFRFPIRAGQVGDATVQFAVALGALHDAFQVPLSIKPLDLTESVVDSGATQGGATIPISVLPSVLDEAGGLDVSIASTLLPETIAPARSIFEFDFLPFAEPLSSRVLAGADMRILATRYGQTIAGIDPVKEVDDALSDLQRLQAGDGGILWYPTAQQSDPFLSAYAAEAIGQATKAGFDADRTMVARLDTYLTARLDDPDPDHWCTFEQCIERMRFEAMQGLAALGHVDESHVDQVYAERDNFDLDTRVELALYLTRLAGWKSQASALSSKLQELVYETGRYATLNLPDDLWWCDSVTKAQADAVRLFIARHVDSAVSDRMVRSLLALRRQGRWENTYDDAQALSALVDYASGEPLPPDFTAVVALGGSTIASADFHGYKNVERDSTVAMSSLAHGRSDLVLSKHGTGTLHYVVTYSYRLVGPQPGIGSGLIVSRDVEPAAGGVPVARMAFSRPAAPFTLQAGKVYDVGVTLVSDHPVNQVVIVDPLPAGLEAVDTSFDTAPRSQSAMDSSWAITYQQIYHDRVVAYADYLPPGVYTLHYLARSVTPGTYEWPGTQAFLQYAPEELGRAASATAIISN